MLSQITSRREYVLAKLAARTQKRVIRNINKQLAQATDPVTYLSLLTAAYSAETSGDDHPDHPSVLRHLGVLPEAADVIRAHEGGRGDPLFSRLLDGFAHGQFSADLTEGPLSIYEAAGSCLMHDDGISSRVEVLRLDSQDVLGDA